MTAETGYYLDSFLAPLAPVLARSDVTDIYVNRPNEIWIESLGGRIEWQEVTGLAEPDLARLARHLSKWWKLDSQP